MKKRIYAVICSLILTLVCFGLPVLAAAKNRPPVNMEVSSIYGEIGKMGVHVPVFVELAEQSGDKFEGTLVIQTLENASESGEEVYEYQYPVTLEAGETKEMELYVPLGQRSSEIHVLLLDEGKEEIGAETMFFDISRDMGRFLIGALTETEDDLQYLDGVSLDYGMVQSKLLFLNAEQFPEHKRGLEMLDLIVINRYETDSLSDAQIKALSDWVEDGGTLLFGTGATAYSTLGPFADGLVELPIGSVFYEDINLGAEYAEKAPGDSDVNMVCVELVIPDGTVIVESDGVPLLTMAERGNGKIGIYCYDLSEISVFAEKNPTYVNKMLTDVLNESEISNLFYYSSYGSDEEYWNAYSLVNIGNADRLPNLGLYAAVIVVYILIAGPGLYLILKKKDLSRLYSILVIATSVSTAAVIYMMGIGTRFTSQFFTIASIIEMEGNVVNETSYMNVRTPDSRPFSVTIPAEYSVTPLTRTSRYDEIPVMDFERNEESVVELKFDQDGTRISSRRSKAFEPRFFKVSQEGMKRVKPGVSGSVQLYDGKISGILANNLPFALEDAALVMYGQMYMLGKMEAGEVREFHNEPLLIWPVTMAGMVAGEITGSSEIPEGSEEYWEKVEHDRLISYYVAQQFTRSSADGYLIGIGPSGGVAEAESFAHQSVEDLVLYASKLSVTSGNEGLVYRSGLMNRPIVNSGNGAIYGDGLTMYGNEPLVVEYVLGEDVEVEKVSFLPISEAFMDEPDYYYMKRYDGAAYFYNYTTKSYDRINLAQVDFMGEELRPYLSSTGHIIVKYTITDHESAGVSSLLPHLMVTGRER